MAGKQILIAEDSSVIQNLAKKILEFQNYQILTAKNGQKVLELLETKEVDIILMDISMPIMDGLECARRIRSLNDPKKASVPIIAITGNAQNLSMEDFKQAGINEYILKPVNFDHLIEVLKKY